MKMRLLVLVTLFQTTLLLGMECAQQAQPNSFLSLVPEKYARSNNENSYFMANTPESLETVLDHVYECIVRDHEANTTDKPSAVIFDVDKTSIFYGKSDAVNGITPIKAVHRFYSKLVTLGIEIIFLTTRSNKYLQGLQLDLADCGYKHDATIVVMTATYWSELSGQWRRTHDLEAYETARGRWKAARRTKLAERYTILATLDDLVACLAWGPVGIAVHVDLQIPNEWTDADSNHPLLTQA